MRFTVARYNPETDSEPYYQEYVIPDLDRVTVLQGLMYINDQIDSTLSFSYNCRFKRCGLCAMMVSGQPRMACMTALKEGAVLQPLRNLPVLRDLVVDRRQMFDQLAALAVYLPNEPFPATNQAIHVPPERRLLAGCTECLACLSACPHYDPDDHAFAGPLLFVKLAQLHMDPRDPTDRRAQAQQLGIATCVDCRGCPCPSGIPIRRGAVAPLLGESVGA